jgi:hypothetical protein
MSVDDPGSVGADAAHDAYAEELAYQQDLADRLSDHEPVSLHVARAALAVYDNPTSPTDRAALLRAIRDDLRTGRPSNAVDPSSVAAFPDAGGRPVAGPLPTSTPPREVR